VQRRARIETAGKRDADFLAGGNALKNRRHEETIINAEWMIAES
jgi:hypothetical protein